MPMLDGPSLFQFEQLYQLSEINLFLDWCKLTKGFILYYEFKIIQFCEMIDNAFVKFNTKEKRH